MYKTTFTASLKELCQFQQYRLHKIKETALFTRFCPPSWNLFELYQAQFPLCRAVQVNGRGGVGKLMFWGSAFCLFYTFVNFKQFLYRNQSSCLLIVTTVSPGATKGKKNRLQYTSRNIFENFFYFQFWLGIQLFLSISLNIYLLCYSLLDTEKNWRVINNFSIGWWPIVRRTLINLFSFQNGWQLNSLTADGSNPLTLYVRFRSVWYCLSLVLQRKSLTFIVYIVLQCVLAYIINRCWKFA